MNCTPDSFSDGGAYFSPAAARRQVIDLFAAGADAVDIGAESTRPGATPVLEQEEWQRLAPVLEGLREEVVQALPHCRPVLSIDTQKPGIARRAWGHGVSVINDVSGASNLDLLAFAAEKKCPYVMMHTRGTPQTMMRLCDYGASFFETFLQECRGMLSKLNETGVEKSQIIFDPGIGFAKTAEQSRLVLNGLTHLAVLDLPLLVGPSRKSFLRVHPSDNAYTEDGLDDLTLAACVLARARGASFFRVHQVKKMAPILRFANEVLKSV